MHTGTITTWAGIVTSLTLFVAQNTRDTSAQTPQAQRDGVNVQALAAWLALGNHSEIELSKLAAERSTNPEVKAFANKMVQDHTAFLGKLRQFMPTLDEVQDQGERGIRPGAQPDARPGAQPGAQPDQPRTLPAPAQGAAPAQPGVAPARPGAAPAQPGAIPAQPEQQAQQGREHHGQMLQIATRAAQIELAMTRQLLEKYSGQDFDMAYLGQQIVAHTHMLAVLEAMKNEGPREFQQLVAQGIEVTKHHMGEATRLAKSLEDQEGPRQEVKTPVREPAASPNER